MNTIQIEVNNALSNIQLKKNFFKQIDEFENIISDYLRSDPKLYNDDIDIKFSRSLNSYKTPQIRHATVSRLLDRLTDLRFLSCDFLNTFLMTYSIFTTGSMIIETLRHAYRKPYFSSHFLALEHKPDYCDEDQDHFIIKNKLCSNKSEKLFKKQINSSFINKSYTNKCQDFNKKFKKHEIEKQRRISTGSMDYIENPQKCNITDSVNLSSGKYFQLITRYSDEKMQNSIDNYGDSRKYQNNKTISSNNNQKDSYFSTLKVISNNKPKNNSNYQEFLNLPLKNKKLAPIASCETLSGSYDMNYFITNSSSSQESLLSSSSPVASSDDGFCGPCIKSSNYITITTSIDSAFFSETSPLRSTGTDENCSETDSNKDNKSNISLPRYSTNKSDILVEITFNEIEEQDIKKKIKFDHFNSTISNNMLLVPCPTLGYTTSSRSSSETLFAGSGTNNNTLVPNSPCCSISPSKQSVSIVTSLWEDFNSNNLFLNNTNLNTVLISDSINIQGVNSNNSIVLSDNSNASPVDFNICEIKNTLFAEVGNEIDALSLSPGSCLRLSRTHTNKIRRATSPFPMRHSILPLTCSTCRRATSPSAIDIINKNQNFHETIKTNNINQGNKPYLKITDNSYVNNINTIIANETKLYNNINKKFNSNYESIENMPMIRPIPINVINTDHQNKNSQVSFYNEDIIENCFFYEKEKDHFENKKIKCKNILNVESSSTSKPIEFYNFKPQNIRINIPFDEYHCNNDLKYNNSIEFQPKNVKENNIFHHNNSYIENKYHSYNTDMGYQCLTESSLNNSLKKNKNHFVNNIFKSYSDKDLLFKFSSKEKYKFRNSCNLYKTEDLNKCKKIILVDPTNAIVINSLMNQNLLRNLTEDIWQKADNSKNKFDSIRLKNSNHRNINVNNSENNLSNKKSYSCDHSICSTNKISNYNNISKRRSFSTTSKEAYAELFKNNSQFSLKSKDYEARRKVTKCFKNINSAASVRVLNILKQWVVNHSQDFDSDYGLKKKVQTLIEEILAGPNTTQEETKLASNILDNLKKLNENSKLIIFDIIKPPKQASEYEFDDLSAIDIAKQITFLDHNLFVAIQSKELLAQSWMKSDKTTKAPNVLLVSKRFNETSRLVVCEIVRRQNLNDRVCCIDKWTNIAEICKNLNNFNGVLQICAAFVNSSVYRLRKTWEKISKQTKVTIERLQTLVSSDCRFRNMREALHNCQPPCIPYLGMYLTDLTFIEEGTTNTTEEGLVNFSKMRMIAHVIREIQFYQQSKYHISHLSHVTQYLLDPSKLFDEEDAFTFSLEIEPRSTRSSLSLQSNT